MRAALLAAAALLLVPAPAAAAPEPLATCFWEGPISMKRPTSRGFDGRSFNFPEESATYWLARLRLPAGARLELAGRFSRSRYQSLNAYTDGAPTDALADVQTEPDPGAVNPFRAGARRDGDHRGWRVRVVDAAVPAAGPRAPNTLYARAEGDAPIELAYRVYEPDRGLDLDGGTGLPAASVVLADGRVLEGAAACAAVNDADRSIPVQTIPAATWQAGRRGPGCDGATNPAYDPIRWERFFTIEEAQEAVLLDCTPAGRAQRRASTPPERGGFYSNRDNAYVFAHLSRRFGELVVLRAAVPTTPQTFDGQPVMGTGQLRFWSLCTGESRVTVRTPDCLSDREVPIGPGRRTTVVVSKAADRPANARPECGVAWLDWGAMGDGAGDPDYGLLILRNMLPAAGFAQAVQRVTRIGSEADVMGEHFPETAYGSKRGFEARGCRESAVAVRTARLQVDRLGRVAVRVSCTTSEAGCAGAISVRGRGRRTFALAAGTARTFRVPAVRGTRRAASVRVLVTATTTGGLPLRATTTLRR